MNNKNNKILVIFAMLCIFTTGCLYNAHYNYPTQTQKIFWEIEDYLQRENIYKVEEDYRDKINFKAALSSVKSYRIFKQKDIWGKFPGNAILVGFDKNQNIIIDALLIKVDCGRNHCINLDADIVERAVDYLREKYKNP